MNRPARWLIPLALAACALAWWWSLPPPEPICEGAPFSHWLRYASFIYVDDFPLAVQKVRAIGNPAVKRLAYLAEHGNSSHIQPGPIERMLAGIRPRKSDSDWPHGYDERAFAMTLLGGMGTQAKPAIPALVRVLNSEIYDHVYTAATALHVMGADSWPAVEEHLLHGSNLVRCALLNKMWYRLGAENDVSESDVVRVFALLTRALHDSEPNIRRNAATSLAYIFLGRKAAIPGPLADQAGIVLWPLPGESSNEVREAKEAMRSYYRDTRGKSVPRLTTLLDDPDEAKRNFAHSVLAQIEMDSAGAGAP